jgi:hypothetical protein
VWGVARSTPHPVYCRGGGVGGGSDRQRVVGHAARSSDQSYDRGYWAGTRARPERPDMPPAVWKGLILLCHPDKYAQEPGLQTLAGEVTRWLLEHRPCQKEGA